jgi:hypothetical protein
LGVSFSQNLWVQRHGLPEREDERARGIGAALEKIPTHDVNLFSAQPQLVILVKYAVQKGVEPGSQSTPSYDLFDEGAVQTQGKLTEILSTCLPVTPQPLWQIFKQREEINWRRGSDLAQREELSHELTELQVVRRIVRGGTYAEH